MVQYWAYSSMRALTLRLVAGPVCTCLLGFNPRYLAQTSCCKQKLLSIQMFALRCHPQEGEEGGAHQPK